MCSYGCSNGLEGMTGYSGGSASYGRSNVYNSCAAPSPMIYSNPAQSFSSSSIQDNYRVSNSISSDYACKPSANYSSGLIFSANPFINKFSSPSVFVDSAGQIKPLIEEAFKATTGKDFPNDVIVNVCDDKKMMMNHPDWTPAISGFAINSFPRKIFVRENGLEEVMVTLGHEIGHILSESLNDEVDEEAKAFSFCISWIKAIKEKNIGNLSENLVIPEPARNGIHNVALKFVLDKLSEGLSAFDLFDLLASKSINCFSNFAVYC